MTNWLGSLLKKPPASAASSDESAQPRIRDADGRQLAQLRNVMRDELEWLEESAAKAHAGFGIDSCEHERSDRARKRARKLR